MSGFGIAHNNIRTDNPDYKTKQKDNSKEVSVDGRNYIVSLPSGNQHTAFSNCQKPDKFGPVYDKLRETHADKIKGGLKLPEFPYKKGDDALLPHIRAIRQAFEDTGTGWGSGIGCKFWYDNLYFSDNYDLYSKQMYLNIRPTKEDIVRAKAGKKAACEDRPAEKVAAEEPPAEKVAAEEPPAQKVSSSSQPAPKPSVSKRGPNTDSMGRISVEFIIHDKSHYAMEKGKNCIFFWKDWRDHARKPETHYPTQIAYIKGDGIPGSGENMPDTINVLDRSKQRPFEYADDSGYNTVGGQFIYPLKSEYELVITKSKEEFEQEKREAEYKEFVDSLKEVTYNGHKLYYAPYNERWHQFPLYDKLPDEDGDLVWKTIGDYDARSAADIPDPTKDNWVIQYHGYNPDSSDEEDSDQEHHQEIPKEWRKQFSRSKKLSDGTPRPYWVNVNEASESVWVEPREAKEEREQQEKFEREYKEDQRNKKESEAKREAEQKESVSRNRHGSDALRARLHRKREEAAAKKSTRGGKRKTKRRQNAGSGKGIKGPKSTKKKEVSWPDQRTYAIRFPRMTPTLLEKGLARAAPSIKKGPTPGGEPWDIENQHPRNTPIKSAIKKNKGTNPLTPLGLPRPHGLGGKRKTKRRKNAGSGKGTMKKSEVSWKDEPFTKKYPRIKDSLLEKGYGNLALSIKKGPTPGGPVDIEMGIKPIKSAMKSATKKETRGGKRKNNKKRTIKRRK